MIRFVEYPQWFAPARFAEARDRLVQRAVHYPWVKGVWQFGGDEPIPGYSDIDLLVWVDGREVRNLRSLFVVSRDAGLEGAGHVFRHDPVVVDDQSLSDLCYYVDPSLARFRQLAGPPFSLPVLGEAETAAVQLAKAIDCLPRTLCLLVRSLNSRATPIVRALRQLNHFAINCGRLGALGLLPGPLGEEASQLADDVTQFRARLWRETRDRLGQELAALLRRAFELYFELVPALDAAQQRLGFESPIGAGGESTAFVTDVGGYVVRDAEGIRERFGGVASSHFCRQDGAGGTMPVVPVSRGFLTQMLLYAIDSPGEGFLDFLTSHCAGDELSLAHDANVLAAAPEREDDVYGRIVARRARLAHRHMEFLAEAGCVRGLEPAFTGLLWTYRRMVLLARRRGRSDGPIWLSERLGRIRSRKSGWDL